MVNIYPHTQLCKHLLLVYGQTEQFFSSSLFLFFGFWLHFQFGLCLMLALALYFHEIHCLFPECLCVCMLQVHNHQHYRHTAV